MKINSVWLLCTQTGKALAIGIESLTMEGGGLIEDLDVDFTLPGYPDIALKVPVMIGDCMDSNSVMLFYALCLVAWREGYSSLYSQPG